MDLSVFLLFLMDLDSGPMYPGLHLTHSDEAILVSTTAWLVWQVPDSVCVQKADIV